jgi:hypothetical protein
MENMKARIARGDIGEERREAIQVGSSMHTSGVAIRTLS